MRNILWTIAALAFGVAVCASPQGGSSVGLSSPFAGALIDRHGCVVRCDTTRSDIYWVFSADSMFEGGPAVLDALAQRGLKASFFFTGRFLRDSANRAVIEHTINEGHYVGGHSDAHLQLCDWDEERTALVSADSLLRDLSANMQALASFGIDTTQARVVLPPFEWCSALHSAAYRHAGIVPANISPGIIIYRDYTTPDMADYRSSDEIISQLFEAERTRGLNGAILIMHAGTQDARSDKLYRRLGPIIDSLSALGYSFRRF